MDTRRIDAEPTAEERAAVDALLGPPGSAWEGADRGDPLDAHLSTVGGRDTRALRPLLLPALQALQSRVGWISEAGLGYVCQRLNVPPADAWGVATFYALLATEPRPAHVVHVCDDIACKARGADALIDALTPSAAWHRSPCLGMCDRSPAAFVTVAGEPPLEFSAGNITDASLAELVGGHREHPTTGSKPGAFDPGGPGRSWSANPSATATGVGPLLRRVGVIDPTSLDAYRASGGYAALEKARAMGPDAVIAELVTSKLMGRGGAAFPTGRKWEAVRRAPALPHYVVCNADESEPGTFKDRVLMEADPFAIVEAIAIASFVAGCEHAFIYIRGEYPLAAARIRHAIDASRGAGLLAGVDIEIRRGGGAYICGEETALFESIEGRRGEPRSKPPFPVDAGLFGKPTVVNNVETLANVPHIVLHGGAAYAAIGTTQSTGTRLFCLSGSVRRPGLYEAPMGTTLRTVIEMAGGVEESRMIRAVLLGGAAGTFIGPDELDLRLTHEDTRAASATLGSGVVMVFDDRVDLKAIVTRIASFFRDESCGQCVPCRVGTIRQEEALHRLAGAAGAERNAELSLLDDLGAAMRDASICGLGQTAYSAVESAIKRLKLYA